MRQALLTKSCPGITAAMAVASYCGIPLTHRDVSSAVAFVTGQQKEDDEHPAPLDYRMLAQFPGTLVFYMGVTTAEHWTAELIAGGKPARYAGGHRAALLVARSDDRSAAGWMK